MQNIQSILNIQPKSSLTLLRTESSVVWICWNKEPDPQIAKVFEDFGGIQVAEFSQQSLWFFFNPEATFYALARLDIWSKQNSTAVVAFTFPGTLVVGKNHILTIELDEAHRNLTAQDPKGTSLIFTHPKYLTYATSLPGISFYEMLDLEKQGLFGWKGITADKRLPFNIEKGWFGFIHPIGHPLDKGYLEGWGKFISHIQPMIDNSKFKYSIQDRYLTVFIPTISQLKDWVSQVLNTFQEISTREQDYYWPFLSIIVDKDKHNFTHNIHETFNIDWENMMPDQMYASYKNALLLGKSFGISDLSYSGGLMQASDLCSVLLSSQGTRGTTGTLFAKILMPEDKNCCFYCGSASHSAVNCPTKSLEPIPEGYWNSLISLDFEHLERLYLRIDNEVQKDGMKAYSKILAANDMDSEFLRATLAINHVCQLPNMERIWNVSSRNVDDFPEKYTLKNPAVSILKRYVVPHQDINALERDCYNNMVSTGKSWHLHCLMGFIKMEKQDFRAAKLAWTEAESMCSTTIHQAWIKFLLARLLEIQGQYTEAIESYKKINALIANWYDVNYRILICQVKMGFAQKVENSFVKLVYARPELMHKIFLDPELYRGKVQIVNSLQSIWDNAHTEFLSDRDKLHQLLESLQAWFYEDDNPMTLYGGRIRHVLEYGTVRNYLLCMEVSKLKPQVDKDIQRVIAQETDKLRAQYEKCLKRIEIIRDEMNWFYLQTVFVDFNKAFNDCAQILNWAFASNFNDVEVFKQARQKLPELQKHIKKLQSKLSHLRIIRDFTLFIVLFSKSFFKTATALCVIATIGVFALLFFGQWLGLSWLQKIIQVNFWEILKVVLYISLMAAFGSTALKTTVIFEGKKNELLTEARDQRMKIQQKRLANAKRKREENLRQNDNDREWEPYEPGN